MADHKLITDPEIHEPKGVSTAPSKSVYVANGAGSGAWQTLSNYFSTEGVDGAVLTQGSVTTAKLATLAVTSDKIANKAVGYPQLGLGAVHGENLGSYNAASVDGKVIWKLILNQIMSDSYITGEVCPMFGSVDAQLFVNGSDYSKVSSSGVGSIVNLGTLSSAGGSAFYLEIRTPLPDQTMVMSTHHTGYYPSPQGTIESVDHALPLSSVGIDMPTVPGHPQSGSPANELVYSKTYMSMLAKGDLVKIPTAITFSQTSTPLFGTYIIDQVFDKYDVAPANVLQLHARFRRIG